MFGFDRKFAGAADALALQGTATPAETRPPPPQCAVPQRRARRRLRRPPAPGLPRPSSCSASTGKDGLGRSGRSRTAVAFSFDPPPQRLLSSVHRASRPAARRSASGSPFRGPKGDFARARASPASRPNSGSLCSHGVPSVAKKVEGAFRAGRRFPETGVNLARRRGDVKLVLAHSSVPSPNGRGFDAHLANQSVAATSALAMPGSPVAWPAAGTISNFDPGHAWCSAQAVAAGVTRS